VSGSRSYARVDVELPLRARRVDPAEAKALAGRFGSEPTYLERPRREPREAGAASWERSALAAILGRLDALESAIEKIAAALQVDLVEGGPWVEGETVSLSGSGIGARLPQPLERGDFVELELSLLGDPSATVRGLAEVASFLRPDGADVPVGRFHVGLSFAAIHDEDREAIIRYSFRIQRATLRERRGESGGDVLL
jgi:hypothetical protein